MNACFLVLAATLGAAPAPAPRVALLPLEAGAGVKPKTAASFSDVLAAEVRKLGKVELITDQEVSAVLTVERQKQLIGCADSGCMTELAGALDVDELLTGSLARLGESWLFQVQRVDARTGESKAHASRRKKGGGIDDLLDELPAMVAQLFSGTPPQPKNAVTRPEPKVAPKAAPETKALPPPYGDVALKEKADLSKLVLLTDGEGHYIAVEPFKALDGNFFAGDRKALYRQRVFGGGRNGDKSFDLVFWDPRARARYQAGFQYRDGKYQLQCGEKQIDFKPLPARKSKALLKRAKLYDVRWQRHAYALARDDDGTWFYVDQALAPEDNTDFRLYTGTRGALAGFQAEVLAHDAGGDIFRAAGGKLKVNVRKAEGEWQAGDGKTKLTVLPVEDHAQQIYSSLGAYAGMPLGTPCDAHFP